MAAVLQRLKVEGYRRPEHRDSDAEGPFHGGQGLLCGYGSRCQQREWTPVAAIREQ